MRVFRIILFNVIGLIVGILAGDIAFNIAKWLLVDLLGNFKLLTTILSWPVEYETYAFTGIICATAGAALYSCSAICRFGKGNFNFACLIVGLYEIIIYMISFIGGIAEHGFSFDVLWMIVVTLLTFVIFSFSTAANDEL